jgi:hypothetical protein
VDADTKEPSQLKLGTAGLKLGEHWPKLAVVGTGKPSELEVRWAAPGPVAVRVSSAGYEEQQLTLDRDSEHRIVVPLQRLERPVEHVEHP